MLLLHLHLSFAQEEKMFGPRELLAASAMNADYSEPPPPAHRQFHFHMRGRDSWMADDEGESQTSIRRPGLGAQVLPLPQRALRAPVTPAAGVTHNEKMFMYFLALSGFLAILCAPFLCVTG